MVELDDGEAVDEQAQKEAAYHFALCKFEELVKEVGARQIVRDLKTTTSVALYKALLMEL